MSVLKFLMNLIKNPPLKIIVEHLPNSLNNMEIIKEKVCSRCGRSLPITEFGLNKKAADGHNAICKECDYQIKSKPRKPNLARVSTDDLLTELQKRQVRLSKVEPTPRELMQKLYKMGYRGSLKIVREETVDLAAM